MENDLEIYRQRYETFRHLDTLKWQMLQLVIAIVAGVGTFVGSGVLILNSFGYILLGLSFICIGFVQRKICLGIEKNSIILVEFGKKIGDTKIPIASAKFGTMGFTIYSTIILLGIACWIYAIKLLICTGA